jgi:hypothetical protein
VAVRRQFRFRAAVVALTAAVGVSACGAATLPPSSASATPLGPAEILGFTIDPLPTGPDATLTRAAETEVALVHQLRDEAGIAGLIGADGPAALTAIDAAETRFGEATLPDFANQLDMDLSASALVASAGIGPGAGPAALNGWTGSFIGRVSFTASMMMGLLATAVERADTTNPRNTVESSQTFRDTSGGVSEVTTLHSKLTLATGGGRIEGDVELDTMSVLTETATGRKIGTLTGAARGHLDASACPDANGVAAGHYSLSLAEQLSPGTGSASASTRKFDGAFAFHDGDDAHLVETTLDLALDAAAVGPGLGPGDPDGWGVSAFLPMVLPANGPARFDAGRATSALREGATTAQLKSAVVSAAVTVGLSVAILAQAAEKFWRSGKCVEIVVEEGDSRQVERDEHVQITAHVRHRFDKTELDKPIVATLEGVASLDPTDTPVAAPASFTYVAGRELNDKGVVTLTSTSNRGIGSTTATYNVGGYDTLTVAIHGGIDWKVRGFTRNIQVDGRVVVRLEDDGFLHGTGTFHVTFFNQAAGGCPVTFEGDVPAEVSVYPGEPDEQGRIGASVRGPDPPYHRLGDEHCMFGSDLGTEFGLWALGVLPRAVVDGGPNAETTTGPDGSVYSATTTIAQ